VETITAVLHVASFLLGAVVVATTLVSAVSTFVLPRGVVSPLARVVFITIRVVLELWIRRLPTFAERDRVLAVYAPFGLLTLPVAWLALVLLGYTAMFWALGVQPWSTALTTSGSSLFTLGFATLGDLPTTLLAFTEATIGLILIALLISYLPTMYSAFSRRETAVTLLAVRAGSPPSAVEMIWRFHAVNGLDGMHDLWVSWEQWFAELEETHTSLAALPYFRSSRPERSWVTAAGTVLDAAALRASTLDLPRDAQAELCIRAGFLALRKIADLYRIQYDPDPQYGDPISVTRQEFDDAYERLAQEGVPLKPDREQAWQDFAGWRVNYDTVLLGLAAFIMAPDALWSSDRLPEKRSLLFLYRRRL
jgi:hypothetical protein